MEAISATYLLKLQAERDRLREFAQMVLPCPEHQYDKSDAEMFKALLAKERDERDKLRTFKAHIDLLRIKEGDAVTILCDNPDGPPEAVECNGGWTQWKEARFTGATIAEALENAVNAKMGAK